MTSPFALDLTPPDADRARLAALEAELSTSEAGLLALKIELQQLQSRYLEELGGCYAELADIEAAAHDAEVRAGLREPPIDAGDPDADETGGLVDATCANRSAPSDDLKRVFRDLAKAIHPDLASDDAARRRRHALMAEANRAYAERDEDRLRLIQRAWERHPEAVIDESPGADRRRTLRLISEIEERLVAIGGEFADLRASAIWQLKGKIDDAKAQGWDLFAEMILQVKRDIGRAKARLASAERAIRKTGSSAFGA